MSIGYIQCDGYQFSLHKIIIVQLRNEQFLAYVNVARLRSWNQPVLSNDGNFSCSMTIKAYSMC